MAVVFIEGFIDRSGITHDLRKQIGQWAAKVVYWILARIRGDSLHW